MKSMHVTNLRVYVEGSKDIALNRDSWNLRCETCNEGKILFIFSASILISSPPASL